MTSAASLDVPAPAVYLDHAASTPMDPGVAAVMFRCLGPGGGHGNASALGHAPGRAAQALVERARVTVGRAINAGADGLVWTSGATEANNLAILGSARFRAGRGRHIVTALTEHKSVTEPVRYLERHGYRVTWLRPDGDGLVAPGAVAEALKPDTILVSLMLVNNETGVVQDVAAVGRLCRERDVLLHVDGAQAVGRVPVDVAALGVDLLSLSAHKIHGPKGVGALFIHRQRVNRVEPLLYGGGQERGLRPGTLPTHQLLGMAEAFRLARLRLATDGPRIAALRDRLWDRLRNLPGVLLNGHPRLRAPHILNVSVEGVEGESLFYGLRDLAVASGSACTSATGESSYVLRLLGRSAALAGSSVRFSLARTSTAADVDLAGERFVAVVQHLRRVAPAGL